MTKLLYPILILGGVFLGIVIALSSKKRSIRYDGQNHLRKIVAVTAAFVAGMLASPPSAESKPPAPKGVQVKCYIPSQLPGGPHHTAKQSLERIEKQVSLLTKLFNEGKLTENIYGYQLGLISKHIAVLWKYDTKEYPWDEETLDSLIAKIIKVRSSMNDKLVKAFANNGSMKTLKSQLVELRLVCQGKDNNFSSTSTTKALETLAKDPGFPSPLADAIATVMTATAEYYATNGAPKDATKEEEQASLVAKQHKNLAKAFVALSTGPVDDALLLATAKTFAHAVPCLDGVDELCESYLDASELPWVQLADIIVKLHEDTPKK